MPKLPRLKSLREAAFLTQAELAEKAGVHIITVQRLESPSDPGNASLKTARNLAKALGVEPSELTRDG